MKRGPWFFKKAIGILVIGAAAILLFGFIVMSLWNGILPAVIHVGTITFGQALGILVLSKILFGGFHGRGKFGGGGPGRWKQHMGEGMKEKWMNMSPEEREKFQQDWRNRCSGGWRRPSATQADAAE
jgi:Ca2+/H+ antiporter, TMEM165/GDT1 family